MNSEPRPLVFTVMENSESSGLILLVTDIIFVARPLKICLLHNCRKQPNAGENTKAKGNKATFGLQYIW